MSILSIGSLFAGIGGFELGMEKAGFRVSWQVEIDKFCQKVLSRHWPKVPRYTDIKEVNPLDLETVTVICGGFPCQDLSLAGKRQGLAGERSGLFYEMLRIIDAFPSAWVLAENVPGLLSSKKGEDFACVIGELSGYFPEPPATGWKNAGIATGPNGTVAWRVLDAQYFGVPQRRRRIFIVRSPGTCRTGAVQVLFESTGLQGYPSTDRSPKEKHTGTLAYCLNASSQRQDASLETYIPVLDGYHARIDGENISPTLRSRMGTGGNNVPMIANTIRSGGSGGVPSSRGENLLLAPTLSAKNEPANSQNTREEWYSTSANLLGRVRRLTPVECERLQGFPDNWTVLPDSKNPDSPRYKACGNAVCVNVAEWIGHRLMSVINSIGREGEKHG